MPALLEETLQASQQRMRSATQSLDVDYFLLNCNRTVTLELCDFCPRRRAKHVR